MENNKPDLKSLQIDKTKRYDDKPRSKVWNYLIAIVVIIVLVISYFMFQEKIKPATQIKTTSVYLLSGENAQAELVASGYVVAQRNAEVASKGTGRLKYLGFEEGDKVEKNAIIAEIENDDIKANLNIVKAKQTQAEVDTLRAGRNYRRQQALFKSGSITETVLEDAEATYKSSLAVFQGAVASVTAAEVDLENTYIRAPFAGTILTKNADIGEIVAPFASSASSKGSVVTLADMNSLEVEADVSESNIYKVSVGQKCTIVLDAYPNTNYEGFVKKIVPTADRSRATVLTKVGFKEINDRVLPEMSARVNFFNNETKIQNNSVSALVVSKDALTKRNNKQVVFRINGEFVELIEITTGREFGDQIEIKSGLSVNDKVVISPPGKMIDHEKIEITK